MLDRGPRIEIGCLWPARAYDQRHMAGDVSHLEGSIISVTGPMAAGKSTIAHALAETFPKGAHVEGDVFRRFVVAGRSEVTPEPNDDALEQLRLRYRLTAEVAERYASAGFTVVAEDVVAGPLLGEFVSLFTHRPLHLVVLLPDEKAIALREAGRREEGYGSWTVSGLYRVFVEQTERLGLWLDTSAATAASTVFEIRSRASESALP
jgi:chloramphenicol 3-O-phosphotransferase